ncbi:MAG: thioredoxin family protein, partial [Melioribacteraceae bacterium]|nr:thioredoxin family protein [Melioribacteraceae bacterium]
MIATLNIIEIIENEGQTFEQFNEESVSHLNLIDPSSLEGIDKNYYEFRKINVQRTKRILKTYNVSDELTDIISKIENPQIWMVLTEDWCGDSAQNLPYIFKMSEQSP